MDFLQIDRYLNNVDNIEILDDQPDYSEPPSPEILFYEKTLEDKAECVICCETQFLNERECCQFRACNSCVNTYIKTQLTQSCGSIRIQCLNSKCTKLIHRDEISERMNGFDKDALKIYHKNLVDANKDSNCNILF